MSEEKFDNTESTVFSAPAEHNDKGNKDGKSHRTRIAVISIVCVLLLVGIIFAVVKFIPDKKEKTAKDNTVKITEIDVSAVDTVSVTGKEESYGLYKKEVDGETKWYVTGMPEEKTGTDQTKNFVNALCALSGTKLTGEDNDTVYGFSEPRFIIEIKSADGVLATLTVGNDAGEITYLKSHGKVSGNFSLTSETATSICKTRLNLANKDSYTPAEFTTDVSAYKDEGGALLSFDSLSLSGGKYEGTSFVFVPNTDELIKETVPYLVSAPVKTYASNVDSVLKLFTDSLSVEGVYSLNAGEEDLKNFGLDNPTIEVKLSVAGETKWFKIAQMDDTYCAVVSDNVDMVRKVKSSYILCFDYSTKDYYYPSLTPYTLDNLTAFTVAAPEGNFNFSVTTTDGKSTVTKDGAEMKTFSNFYEMFKGTAFSKTGTDSQYGQTESTFTLTLTDGRTVALNFSKGEGTKYNVKIGDFYGQITSSSYKKLIKMLTSMS